MTKVILAILIGFYCNWIVFFLVSVFIIVLFKKFLVILFQVKEPKLYHYAFAVSEECTLADSEAAHQSEQAKLYRGCNNGEEKKRKQKEIRHYL